MQINGQQKARFDRNLSALYLYEMRPEEQEQGRDWYRNANNICKEIADCYKIQLPVVCKVMAILSPAASWDNNIKGCWKICRAYAEGALYDSFKVATYGQNKRKAWTVLQGNDDLTPSRTNMKIWNFYNNILNPDGEEHVTIDRHAIKIMYGETKAGSVYVSPKEYDKAKFMYSSVAKRLGFRPHEFQAALWLTYKRKVGR